MEDTRIAWLMFHRLPGLTPPLALRLLERFVDAAGVLAAPAAELAQAGAGSELLRAAASCRSSSGDSPLLRQARQDAAWLSARDAHILPLTDPAYPPLLRETAAPPPLLYLQGSILALSAPQLAVVGSRKPSAVGLEIAQAIAAELAQAGLVVTSGLARGIDSAGHRGALDAGGRTVAVLGAGLDCIYPREHKALARQVAGCGALVSEFPLGTGPSRTTFPRRNRVISGLSLGVLVVEAALRSGSLITARCGREQNREVFAVPGSIRSLCSRGCHALIREGAKLTEHAGHILEELEGRFAPAAGAAASHCPPQPGVQAQEPGSEALRLLLKAVGFEPTPADLAIARSRLPPATVAAALAELELRGLVERTPGGYMRVA